MAKTIKTMMMVSILYNLGVVAIAASPSTASVAPLVLQDSESETNADVERTAASQIIKLNLSEGAHRSTSSRDLAKFEEILQTTARTNYGRITRFEVLVWRGDEAKTAIRDLPTRMKAAGYGFAALPAFDAEPGRVTLVAAVRRDKGDSILGMWIETNDGYALLVWGLYDPDNLEKPGTPAKPGSAKVTKSSGTAVKTGKETNVGSQAAALKRYNDYQYVKLFGPISGPMYRSTKWVAPHRWDYAPIAGNKKGQDAVRPGLLTAVALRCFD